MSKPASNGRYLLIAAAPAEARAILEGLGADPVLAERPWRPHVAHPAADLVICGIGKSNAAGATARFADPARHRAVLSIGVAGALPGSGLRIGDCIAATASVYADEGLLTPDGFSDCRQMGFPLGPFEGSAIVTDSHVLNLLATLSTRRGPIATVSTCSGTDALALQVESRTGAMAECMEGAAIAHIAARLEIPSGELRVISNTTGDRPGQKWDLPLAFSELAGVMGRFSRALLNSQ